MMSGGLRLELPNRIVERFKLVADALWSTNWPIYEILMFFQSRALRNGGLLQFLCCQVLLFNYSFRCFVIQFHAQVFPKLIHHEATSQSRTPTAKNSNFWPISDNESESRSSPLGRAVNYGRRFIQIKVGSHRGSEQKAVGDFPWPRGQRYTSRWKFRIIKVENLHIFEII